MALTELLSLELCCPMSVELTRLLALKSKTSFDKLKESIALLRSTTNKVSYGYKLKTNGTDEGMSSRSWLPTSKE